MSKSIAELRASKSSALPERTYRMCLSQALVGELEGLSAEELEIRSALPSAGDDGRPRKASEGTPPRLAEIERRVEEIRLEMEEHTGELGLRAVSGGEWRRWTDAHPARTVGNDDQGRPIPLDIDVAITGGYCNAVDLAVDLGKYAVTWNGEPLNEGDWEWIENRAASGDLKELCKKVVDMHEVRGALPFPQSASLTSPTSESA